MGPIIKDYRRGRRGFVRYPRGFRDRGQRSFRRGHHPNHNYYGVSRRHEYSRSRSRSISPKRRQIEIERPEINSDDEKTMDSKHSETLKPSDINITEKRLTQSFLAMLEEKQNRAKLMPIKPEDNIDNDPNRAHGFVNTFNSIQKMDRKHTLSYDLEREGWQVIDDANTDSKHNSKSTENDYYDDRRRHSESLASIEPEKVTQKLKDVDSGSSDYDNKKKKKKSKKPKKKKKRKASSSDSSESDSDNDDVDKATKPKKRSKKRKKKSKKKRRKVSSSSSSSAKEEPIKKHKKKKKKGSSSESETSEEKVEAIVSIVTAAQTPELKSFDELSSIVTNEAITENVKTKDKKKSKQKSSDSDSSDSDSDSENKKKKKKKKKKSSKKRRHRSSSSSSSDGSDSSESDDRKKKKKNNKSKKTKSKKHKKKSEKKEKSKPIDEQKKKIKEEEETEDNEFVSVLSVGETPLELKWPKKLIKHTTCLPSLQYSISPKVTPNLNDFKNNLQIRSISEFEDFRRNEVILGKDSHELSSEYERFMGELNPMAQNEPISEKYHSLESELRDKLVKQLYDSRHESQKQDLMTSSERRALERNKKQSYHSYDGSDHKRHEDLKSATLSAYYSPKVTKSSQNHKSSENSDNIESKNSRNHESEHHYKIKINTEEHKDDSSHKQESKSNDCKSDDKKVTARELLERVKQRKHSDKDSKESLNKDKSENKSTKKLPQIGKLRNLSKKSALNKSLTTANADSTQNAFVSEPMKLDMNYDYNWYYNYYMNSVYGIGQYPQLTDPTLASAYYAHYSMLTSYDYNQTDLTNWVTQRGYALDEGSALNQTQEEVKINEPIIENSIKTDGSVESASDLNTDIKINDSNQQSVDIKPNVGQTLEKDSNQINDQKKIEILVSDSYSGLQLEESNETKSESNLNLKNKMSPGFDNNIEPTDNNDSSDASPPPPPPERPVMTTMTSTEPVTLSNGQVLPAGTKQVVVHPYKTGDPYKFTAEWFSDAFNVQNTNQTNS